MTQSASSHGNVQGNRKVALHNSHQPPKTERNRDAELLAVITGQQTELQARQQFRRLSVIHAKAIGACHITKSKGRWEILPDHRTGRLPDSPELISEFSIKLDELLKTGEPVVLPANCLDRRPGLFFPIHADGCEPEILFVVLNHERDAAKAIPGLKNVVDTMAVWLKGNSTNESAWQVNSLSAIIDLVTRIQAHGSLRSATQCAVNDLAASLGCSSVAVGTRSGAKTLVHAISGIHDLKSGSQTYKAIAEVVNESITRGRQGLYPPNDTENDHLLLAHKQLNSLLQTESVISQPLVNSDATFQGAWIFAGTRGSIANDRISRFIDAASLPVADALAIVDRSQMNPVSKLLHRLRNSISKFSWLMIAVALVAIWMLMLVPITYRVRCNCTTEPVSRRFAVAPFDGLITTGFVEPGDIVRSGQVLAEIDGRTIRWELSGISAEKRSAQRQREIELANENIPQLLLAELEKGRLTSEEAVLEFKKDNLQIKSPIDGVVLSGSLERSEASSVETGQVLFEIGPLDAIKVQLEIPADEIAQVKPGHQVKIWIEGNEEQPLQAMIEVIHPRSLIRDARNVFIAELKFDNESGRLRPGMKGFVRIDCDKKTLGWSLFHKPVNFIRSRFTWW